MTGPAPQLQREKTLRPAEVNRLVKELLEDQVPYLCVLGEIANLHRHSASGHVYFSLRDDEASIRCALFRGYAARVRFELENGARVIACGTLSVYVPKGEYQLLVQTVHPHGVGEIQLALQQLAAKLQKEGLLDPARKRPLPMLPLRVGMVTSADGAARHDIEKTIRDRFPGLPVELFAVPVQGEGASEAIAATIDRVSRARPDVDVLIVGRGGGSVEDLWAFNHEAVARAISACRMPVISAVGHEINTTIADLVADVRAKTPTEAAVLAVPRKDDLLARLADHAASLDAAIGLALGDARSRLDAVRESHALQRVPDLVAAARERLDGDSRRLRAGLERAAAAARGRVDLARGALPRSLAALFARHRSALDRARVHLAPPRMAERIARARQRADAAGASLEALSPLMVLDRGYSITHDEAGGIVRDASALVPGDRLRTRFHRGEATSRVEEARPEGLDSGPPGG